MCIVWQGVSGWDKGKVGSRFREPVSLRNSQRDFFMSAEFLELLLLVAEKYLEPCLVWLIWPVS